MSARPGPSGHGPIPLARPGRESRATPLVMRPVTLDTLDALLAIEARCYSHPWSRGNFIDALAVGYLAQGLQTPAGELVAYMIAKRANHLRVQASAVRWGRRGARVNSISPGIVVTPLALHELNSPIGGMYRAMVDASPARRMAPPDEIATAAAYLLGPDAGFITGSDLLIDGGVIAAMKTGSVPTPD